MNFHSVITRITGLLRPSLPAHAPAQEIGVLAPVDILLDHVGADPTVSCPRRWREDCRSYRVRLQVHLQQEILNREHLDRLLEELLASERQNSCPESRTCA